MAALAAHRRWRRLGAVAPSWSLFVICCCFCCFACAVAFGHCLSRTNDDCDVLLPVATYRLQVWADVYTQPVPGCGGKTAAEIFEEAGCIPPAAPSCAACLGGPKDTFARMNEPEVVVSDGPAARARMYTRFHACTLLFILYWDVPFCSLAPPILVGPTCHLNPFLTFCAFLTPLH